LHAVTHGVLTIAGLMCLGFGMALLFQDQPAPFQVNTGLVVGIAVAIAALWAFVVGKGFAARRRTVTSGAAAGRGRRGGARGSEPHAAATSAPSGARRGTRTGRPASRSCPVKRSSSRRSRAG